MSIWQKIAKSGKPPSIKDTYRAPGHLIRRCQQISVSIFLDELGEYGLTPVQYASLLAIHDYPGVDQRGLGNIIAVDRSTITTVLKGLESRELIERIVPPENLRVKQLYITQAGERLLLDTVEEISRVQERIFAPLTAQEQKTLTNLLSRLVHLNNDLSRVPLKEKSDES